MAAARIQGILRPGSLLRTGLRRIGLGRLHLQIGHIQVRHHQGRNAVILPPSRGRLLHQAQCQCQRLLLKRQRHGHLAHLPGGAGTLHGALPLGQGGGDWRQTGGGRGAVRGVGVGGGAHQVHRKTPGGAFCGGRGVAYSGTEVDENFSDPHDRLLDYVVTEQAVIHCRQG